jgi:hypothetical protein
MDLGNLNLFLKLIAQEYKLSDEELLVIRRRLLADDREFEKIWRTYKNKGGTVSGVDPFRFILQDLLS